MKFFLHLIESVTTAKFFDAGEVGLNRKIFRAEKNFGHVADDLREAFAQARVVGVFGEGGASFLCGNFFAESQNIFQRAELFNQLRGVDLPDAFDAGDVIGRVAAQSLEVDELRGREAVFADEFFFVVKFGA